MNAEIIHSRAFQVTEKAFQAQSPFRDNIEYIELHIYAQKIKLLINCVKKISAYWSKQTSTWTPLEEIIINNRINIQLEEWYKTDAEKFLHYLGSIIHNIENELEERTKHSLESGVTLNFENLKKSYGLDESECSIIMLLFTIETDPNFKNAYSKLYRSELENGFDGISIGSIISFIYDDYRTQIDSRKYFSVERTLNKYELVLLESIYEESNNILEMQIKLHERILRFILGDNNVYQNEFQLISRIKSPIKFDQVILPSHIKQEIAKLADSFIHNRDNKNLFSVDDFYGYGTNLVFLFYGPSGTGKTLLAHALSNYLEKELLSIDMANARRKYGSYDSLIKNVFREAKLCNGIVFFDECDDVFDQELRENRTLLIEIEKAKCIIIFSTNRVSVLDPALDRRISMKVPFNIPDEKERECIWKALIPPEVKIAENVDFVKLSKDYIFTGGLIKNALFMAIIKAQGRNGCEKVILELEDLTSAAEHQATSMFSLCGIYDLFAPKKKIENLPLKETNKARLHRISKSCEQLMRQKKSMKLVIGASNIQMGIDCAEAIAYHSKLKVEKSPLDILLISSDYREKVVDPITQKEITLSEYFFRISTGIKLLKLVVDYSYLFQKAFMSDKNDDDDRQSFIDSKFLNNIKDYCGTIILVTHPFNFTKLPIEFDHYLEIDTAPEELQIQQWEKYFPKTKISESQIVDLVERYPLHINEIDDIARQSEIISMIKDGDIQFSMETVIQTIGRSRKKKQSLILFGEKGAK